MNGTKDIIVKIKKSPIVEAFLSFHLLQASAYEREKGQIFKR
jgi:hypothetical protein